MRSLWTEINPTQDLNSHGKPLLQRLDLIKAKASFRALYLPKREEDTTQEQRFFGGFCRLGPGKPKHLVFRYPAVVRHD